ncbi:Unknown protein [Striga hermonthica]|uniref:Uncharacterized protein n=1 Tax=Striga hermonthica TaxID=68872 RepID=A0A9N7NDW9_STRHE|nr:Unknown protein [Striga hermonthica]
MRRENLGADVAAWELARRGAARKGSKMACRLALRTVCLTDPWLPMSSINKQSSIFSPIVLIRRKIASPNSNCGCKTAIVAKRCNFSRNSSNDVNSSLPGADSEQGPPQEAVLKAISEVSKAEGRVGQTTNVVMGGTVTDDSTNEWLALDQKVNSYPTARGFTAIGTGGDDFVNAMVIAVESVLQHPIPQGQVKQKISSGGKYVSVNIGPVQVVSSEQVQAVYNAMRRDDRMKYFLHIKYVACPTAASPRPSHRTRRAVEEISTFVLTEGVTNRELVLEAEDCRLDASSVGEGGVGGADGSGSNAANGCITGEGDAMLEQFARIVGKPSHGSSIPARHLRHNRNELAGHLAAVVRTAATTVREPANSSTATAIAAVNNPQHRLLIQTPVSPHPLGYSFLASHPPSASDVSASDVRHLLPIEATGPSPPPPTPLTSPPKTSPTSPPATTATGPLHLRHVTPPKKFQVPAGETTTRLPRRPSPAATEPVAAATPSYCRRQKSRRQTRTLHI